MSLPRMLQSSLFVTLGVLFLTIASAHEPLTIGEHLRDVVLETPHPYPGARGSSPERVWSDHYHFPGAKHLVFEFQRFDLAPGDWVEVRDPNGEQVHVYRDKGFNEKGGDFITKTILGPEAYIDVYSKNISPQNYGYRIERITRGYHDEEMEALYGGGIEAICGTDDKEDAVCYETSFPEVYDRAMDMALSAHRTLGCRGVSRADFRYDDGAGSPGDLYLLEIHTQPGMTPLSLVPEQAAYLDIGFAELCAWMVENAACDG